MVEQLKKSTQQKFTKPFDHFFVIGLKTQDLQRTKTLSELRATIPEIVSTFSTTDNATKDTLVDLLKDKILIQTIFLCKADYLSEIDFLEDEDEIKINKPIFYDCITYSNTKPREIFHCFNYQSGLADFTSWNMSCLVFWEEVNVITTIEKQERNKVYYAAKAMIIVSEHPYFNLFKPILEALYQRIQVSMNLPIELMIMKIYADLDTENMNTLLKLRMNSSSTFEYFTINEVFLPKYDLNLGAFFNIISLDDFFILAEQFLRRWTIIILSTDPTLFYPFYQTLMALIHPLDITDNVYFYRYLVHEVIPLLLNHFSAFLCINTDKLDDNKIKQIAMKKMTNILVINLDTKEKRMFVPHDTVEIIPISQIYTKSIIRLINERYIRDDLIFEMLDTGRERLVESCKKKNLVNYFQYNHPRNNKWEYLTSLKIRKLFFGLFSKLLAFTVPYTSIEINNNQQFSNERIRINFSNIDDPDLDDFYSSFQSTPSFNIVDKYKVNFSHKNLKNLITLDEIIKIIKLDPKRIYYDPSPQEDFPMSDDEFKVIDIYLMNTFKDSKNIHIDLGSNYRSLHIYNIISLRKKVVGFQIEDLGGDQYVIKYKFLELFFEEFQKFLLKYTNNPLTVRFSKMKKEEGFDVLLYEIKLFHDLVISSTLYIDDLVTIIYASQAVICALEILCCMQNNLYSLIFDKFDQLYGIFVNSRGFSNRFSFVISLLYEIIISDLNLKEMYENDFLNKIKEFQIMPTFFIFLNCNLGTHQISTTPTIDNRKYIYQEYPLTIVKQELVSINDHSKAEYNNITFTNIVSVKCKECKEQFCFQLRTVYDDSTEFEDMLMNPMQIILKLTEAILENNSVRFPTLEDLYQNWKRDLRILNYYINAIKR